MDLAKEIDRLVDVAGKVEVLDHGADEVLGLARAYASDSKHFFEQGKREDALEAYSIAWAYLDALLHLGLIDVPDRSMFTVE
jgi:hypothetical protein